MPIVVTPSDRTLTGRTAHDGPAGTVATAHRPALMGTRHMVAAGHYLAAQAGLQVLEAGGNAVDAGVAAGIALGVLQSDIVNVAGVAPILLRMAGDGIVLEVSGLGHWPRALPPRFFMERHGGTIPHGVLRTVVPAAPGTWIAVLERFGTLSFGDVAQFAIRFARDGFPMHAVMARVVEEYAESYRRWPTSAAIYLPGGRPPVVGVPFVQADLGRTLQYMVDQERAASGRGRAAGLKAARDAFYSGDIAHAILDFHRREGGLLAASDLAAYQPEISPARKVRFADLDVYFCGPWCQGPALGQALNMIDPAEIRSVGHNSVDYVHTLVEVLKLAFDDRERWYGDPRFVDVPLDRLLSADHARAQRALIDPTRARANLAAPGAAAATAGSLDTSYVCVVDRWGNAFSATPSDTSSDTPVVPGTGLCPSSRGSQGWADPAHASAAVAGKRPRLTPSPAMAVSPGHMVMPFGTPGGDVQLQAMLHVLLGVRVFGMDPQAAIEQPRFATYSFPDSFEPHKPQPGRLNLESRFSRATGEALAARGHDVQWWEDWTWRAGGVCAVVHDLASGVMTAGADPRRASYAAGW